MDYLFTSANLAALMESHAQDSDHRPVVWVVAVTSYPSAARNKEMIK